MARIALCGLIITLLLAPAVWAEPANDELRLISLEEAIAIAFDNSLTLQMSRLNVDEAELNLAQVQATNLVQPSPPPPSSRRSGSSKSHSANCSSINLI